MKTRHLLVCVTFVLSLLHYIDRACISVAKDDIVGQFNLTDKEFGWILSIFTLGYALAQTPSGAMADKYGPRKVLTIIVAAWSALTALTGAAFNYVYLLIARFVFGAAEAGAFPSFARATFSWFPVKERGLVTGINFSASRLGAAIALPLMVGLIEAVGWRGSFYVLGGIGLVIAIFWWFWFRDEPADHKLVSAEEKEEILSQRQQVSKADASAKLSVSELTSCRPLWLAMVQYFCSNFTFFFCLGWLFPYVKSTYNLTAADAGLVAAIPLLGGALGNCFSGWLVDKIYSGKRPELSRRIPAITGFILAALGLLVSVHMDSVAPAILFLTIAVFGADMTLSPSWSYCVDIGGKHAGAYSGTMNMAGNIGSFATALAFPYLKDAFGVEAFFYVAAVLNVVAIITWTRMKSPQLIAKTA